MNLLENVSNVYSIDKDFVISCSSREDERNGSTHFSFKFASNIVVRLEIDQNFLKEYNSGDRLQIILGKLNEKYYELKPKFIPDESIKFLEKSRDMFTGLRGVPIPRPYFDSGIVIEAVPFQVNEELDDINDYALKRQVANQRKQEQRLMKNAKAREKRAEGKAEELKEQLNRDDSISRFQDILEED